MDRQDRSDLFEQLVILRRVYHLCSRFDSQPVMTVETAIAEAERLMHALRAPSLAARPA
jgi:hypothetical protein